MTAPLYKSPVSADIAGYGLVGLKALGQEPTEQQRHLLDVVESENDGIPEYDTVVICWPRRAGKSSTLWALAIGRCLEIPDYQVFIALQQGNKGYQRFMAMARDLERYRPDPNELEYRVYRGNGNPHITFTNGSILYVVPPKGEAFRSDSADLLIFDEAQEHDQDKSHELMAGALPLMDTRPRGQVLVAGTARSDRRSGMLWDHLAAARNDPKTLGIVEYAAAEGADLEAESVWLEAHPGPSSGLTPITVLRKRREVLSKAEFEAEYLGVWGIDTTARAIPADLWERTGSYVFADRPERFVLAVDCDIDGSSAALLACWVDEDGVGHGEVLEAKKGVDWVSKTMYDLGKKYPQCVFAWDNMPANDAATEQLLRAKPKNKIETLGFAECKVATASFWQSIHANKVRHYRQPALDKSVEGAARRQIGEGWLWARRQSTTDVCPLVAFTYGLHVARNLKARRRYTISS